MESAAEGKKFDDGKLDWSLLDMEFIEPLIPIFALGEKRYGYLNWQKDFGPDFSRRFQAARKRHEKAAQYNPLAQNEDDDNVYHLAQVAWNALEELYHARKKAKELTAGFISDRVIMAERLGGSYGTGSVSHEEGLKNARAIAGIANERIVGICDPPKGL